MLIEEAIVVYRGELAARAAEQRAAWREAEHATEQALREVRQHAAS